MHIDMAAGIKQRRGQIAVFHVVAATAVEMAIAAIGEGRAADVGGNLGQWIECETCLPASVWQPRQALVTSDPVANGPFRLSNFA